MLRCLLSRPAIARKCMGSFQTGVSAGNRVSDCWCRLHLSSRTTPVWYYVVLGLTRRVCCGLQLWNSWCLRWHRSSPPQLRVSSCRRLAIGECMWTCLVYWCRCPMVWLIGLMSWSFLQSLAKPGLTISSQTSRFFVDKGSNGRPLTSNTSSLYIVGDQERLWAWQTNLCMSERGWLMACFCVTNVNSGKMRFGSGLTFIWAVLPTLVRQDEEVLGDEQAPPSPGDVTVRAPPATGDNKADWNFEDMPPGTLLGMNHAVGCWITSEVRRAGLLGPTVAWMSCTQQSSALATVYRDQIAQCDLLWAIWGGVQSCPNIQVGETHADDEGRGGTALCDACAYWWVDSQA